MDEGLKFVLDMGLVVHCVIEYGDCFDNVLIWSSYAWQGGSKPCKIGTELINISLPFDVGQMERAMCSMFYNSHMYSNTTNRHHAGQSWAHTIIRHYLCLVLVMVNYMLILNSTADTDK